MWKLQLDTYEFWQLLLSPPSLTASHFCDSCSIFLNRLDFLSYRTSESRKLALSWRGRHITIPSWTEVNALHGRTTATWIFSRHPVPSRHKPTQRVKVNFTWIITALLHRFLYSASCRKPLPCVFVISLLPVSMQKVWLLTTSTHPISWLKSLTGIENDFNPSQQVETHRSACKTLFQFCI